MRNLLRAVNEKNLNPEIETSTMLSSTTASKSVNEKNLNPEIETIPKSPLPSASEDNCKRKESQS